MNVYIDSSFAVSIYISDAHSQAADLRLAGHHGLWLTPLHHSEIVHAIEQSVFRGRISASESSALYDDFAKDRRTGLWMEVDLPERTFEISIQLARSHVARIGARTLDTLHVAAALELKAERFWTFDERQAKLAKKVGLKLS